MAESGTWQIFGKSSASLRGLSRGSPRFCSH
jgi:hypothetical protein